MSKTAATLDKPKGGPTPRGRRGTGGRFAPKTEAPAESPAAEETPDDPADQPEVDTEPTTPARIVNGLKVIDIEPVYTGLKPRPGQPRIALKNTVILVLEDGSKVFACADCDFTDPGRGPVMRHRGDVHGQNLGGWPGRKNKADAVQAAGKRLAMEMSLGDVLELGSKLDAYAVIMERQEERIAELRERAEVAERRLRIIAMRLEKAGLAWTTED